jgi:HlyD family secretion protein
MMIPATAHFYEVISMKVMRSVLLVFLILGLLAGASWGVWRWNASGQQEPKFRTEPAVKGKLVATISATGTLVPEEVIDVGAQVAGQILRFGPDLDRTDKTIDYRSRVKKDTILAQIDDRLYAADAETAQADLGMAEATVAQAKADLESMKAKLYQATRDWERARELIIGTTISQADYDTAQYAYRAAKVAVPSGEAAVLRAERTAEKAKATLKRAKQNLDYCTIRSPVDGEIIDRRVNVGQTVVSSLNAPSLFLIAKDLKKMQVWVSVNEADVGSIHKGQLVTFTVDAFPRDVFKGTVGQIRYNATMNQNVVTYTVVVDVPNDDLKLLPYLTANLQFRVDECSNALLVPNAALRWRPKSEQVAEEFRADYEQVKRRKAVAAENNPAAANSHGRATVWVEDNGFARPIKIRTGLTDGNMTEVAEVVKGELTPDTPLIVGQNQSSSASGTVNPFTPKVFGSKKQ